MLMLLQLIQNILLDSSTLLSKAILNHYDQSYITLNLFTLDPLGRRVLSSVRRLSICLSVRLGRCRIWFQHPATNREFLRHHGKGYVVRGGFPPHCDVIICCVNTWLSWVTTLDPLRTSEKHRRDRCFHVAYILLLNIHLSHQKHILKYCMIKVTY